MKSEVEKTTHKFDPFTFARDVRSISMVIPAYNEEGAIADTVSRCLKVLSTLQLDAYEVIVVDDCSHDRTGAIAEQSGASVCTHPMNAGYGHSLKDGMKLAKHDTIIIADADGTYPVEAIPQMLEKFRTGINLVVGKREGEHFRESSFKMRLRRALRFVVELASGRDIPDINSGLRIFSKAEIAPYLDRLCDTFSFTTSQTMAYLMTGKSVAYVDISYMKRVGETKVRLFRDSLRTLQYIILSVLYYKPFKIFVFMSLLCVAFGLLFTAAGLVLQIFAGYYIGIGCILLSLLVFSMGLLAEQLRQIFLQK